MKYILKNKDIDVLEFEVEIFTLTYNDDSKKDVMENLYNIKILREDLLPINFHSYQHLDLSLGNWINNRKVPMNRKFVKNIISTYKHNTPMDYIDICFGLSLNDSYWIIPADSDYKWSNYNLYDNKFSEILELVAFKGESHKVSGIVSSPEYTTNGMIKKCWHRENGAIYLYKGNSNLEYGGKEAYSEYYMAQIAKTMNFNHISYDLVKFHDEIVSACEIFTNENEGYMPIHHFISKEVLHQANPTKLIESINKVYGEESLQDLLLFDSIIYNVDRHLGNFGMIIDNNTNEILRPAPIFDNGLSAFCLMDEENLQNCADYLSQFNSKIKFSFDYQMKRFVQPRHIESLEKLSHFTFKRHHKFNLDEKWLKPLESHIQNRANIAIKLAKEKQQVLSKAKKRNKSKESGMEK